MRAFSVHRFLSRSQTPADQQTDFLYSGTAGSLGTGLKLGLEIGSDMGLGRDRSGRKTMFDRAVLSTVFCAIALGSISLISLTTPASADGDPDAYIEHSYREVPPTSLSPAEDVVEPDIFPWTNNSVAQEPEADNSAAMAQSAKSTEFMPRWEMGATLGYVRDFNSDLRLPPHISATPVRANWSGDSEDFPQTLGLFVTHWTSPVWGWRFAYERQKLSTDLIGGQGGLRVDIKGLHQISANRILQFPDMTFAELTPYAGVGAGIDILEGDYTASGATYDVGGLGGYFATGFLGLRHETSDRWYSFVEAKFSHHAINRKDQGGRFKTKVGVSQLNIGVGRRF